tara:strand:- start:5390 stop:5794 length:405 start_codon:yes stop_codon:yes gene_type:complete
MKYKLGSQTLSVPHIVRSGLKATLLFAFMFGLMNVLTKEFIPWHVFGASILFESKMWDFISADLSSDHLQEWAVLLGGTAICYIIGALLIELLMLNSGNRPKRTVARYYLKLCFWEYGWAPEYRQLIGHPSSAS